MAYLSQSGANLGPSWIPLGSSWAHVGLPDPFPVASWLPTPPLVPYKTENGIQVPNLDPACSSDFLDDPMPSPALLPPEHKETLIKTWSFPGSTSYCLGPVEWGVASFIYTHPPGNIICCILNRDLPRPLHLPSTLYKARRASVGSPLA